MLIFTNRDINTHASDETAFTNAFTPFVDELSCATVKPNTGGKGWRVSDKKTKLKDSIAVNLVSAVLNADKPVLFYLHGNNNTPANCFTRCQQLEDEYGVAVIGFSWTSEGLQPDGQDQSGLSGEKSHTDVDEDSLGNISGKSQLKEGWLARKARRYGQAKLNAQNSKDSLARCLRLTALARLSGAKQKISFAAHSLGCHFLHYAVQDQDAEASLAVMHNVVLLAGCTGAAKHSAWVGQIHPAARVYITYTKADTVVAAAAIIDGDMKLGTAPGPERLAGTKYRYIDFEGAAKMPLGAHRYFVAPVNEALSQQAHTLFSRIFNSLSDFSDPSESSKAVYPLGCNGDGSVCYMGASHPAGDS